MSDIGKDQKTNVTIKKVLKHLPQCTYLALFLELLQLVTTEVYLLQLQEFFVIVTRKLKEPLSIDDASKTIQFFSVYPLVQISSKLILKAIERHQNESFSFWDALIVEAALQVDCKILFSEDMQDERQIGRLKIINPFSNR
jgi:predicted nucleic acid-binding protein